MVFSVFDSIKVQTLLCYVAHLNTVGIWNDSIKVQTLLCYVAHLNTVGIWNDSVSALFILLSD